MLYLLTQLINPKHKMDKILIIGANGQLGTELTSKLREIKGPENVIASDVREGSLEDGPFERLDIMDAFSYQEILAKYNINQVYHLAAILSAKGEQDPIFAWRLNMESLLTVLESGKDQVEKIYWPSSIAVFGPDSPKVNTPQNTVMNPNTVYGISKLAGERWCEYYHSKYGVDVRSLRYPGLIGWKALPGGGTTDYAVDVFHKAISGEKYNCFLSESTALPMMYMDDAVEATIQLMESENNKITVRSSYNIGAISFTPKDILFEINKEYPDFRMDYFPDFRQDIANSWPDSIDDTRAREDWGWKHRYDMTKMSKAMIEGLKTQTVFE